MHTPSFRLLLSLAAILVGGAGSARSEETIQSFHSDIEVHEDALLTVTETLTVNAEGNQIQRGIYRDFPTRYRDLYGNRFRVDFRVESVLRDGRPEPFAVESVANGKRVRIGQADVLLPHGPHTYVISYQTNYQIGYFDDHDELYWNVTGNGWDFVIEQASANVSLPPGIPGEDIKTEAYTGAMGETGAQYRASLVEGERPHFETTAPLPAHHGLTIVVSWPKGLVYQPTAVERWRRMMTVNRSALAALIGLVCLVGYYFAVWAAVGVDPEKGIIVPLYHPPDGVSPAAARYLSRMGYDNKCLAAALINLGVHRRLTLKESKGVYTAERGPSTDGQGLGSDETKLAKDLFGTRKKLRFRQANHQTISKIVKHHRQVLALAYEKTHFVTNRKHWGLGILLLMFTMVAMGVVSDNPPETFFMCVWLGFWTIGVVVLGIGVGSAWKSVLAGPNRFTSAFGALIISAFAVPFFAGEGFGAWQLTRATSPLAVALLIAMAFLLLLFFHLLKAPTLLGRRIMDQLDGFRMYLSVAEEDRLAFMHPPNRTPELFEKYLPYALALDVEQQWAEYFADVLEQATQGPSGQPEYSHWYTSRSGGRLGAAAFAGAIGGALTSAISSSATAPGSSSGSSGGGGGSSGGGGGGGGGGGW